MGGNVPFGYRVENRKLRGDASPTRRWSAACSSGSSGSARRRCWRGSCGTKAWPRPAASPFDKGALYHLLNNRTYLGLAVHKGTAYPGEHAAIIDQDLWDKVHAILAENARTRSAQHPGADAGAAEGADLRADRRGDVADAHPEGQPALPLLRQPGRAEARARCLSGRSGAGGGDRGGGHRPAARRVPAAGDHRRHVARGAGRAGRRHRGRGAGGADCSSTRCGTSCSRPSRRGSCSCWSSGSTCGRTASRSGSGRTG